MVPNTPLSSMTDSAVTTGNDNHERRKRARFFGCDPLPGVVFSLDTSRQALPLHLLGRSKTCVDAASRAKSTCSPLSKGMDDSSTSSALIVNAEDRDHQVKGSLENSCNDDEMEVNTPTDVAMIAGGGDGDANAETPDSPIMAEGDNEVERLEPRCTETQIDGNGQRADGFLVPQPARSLKTTATAEGGEQEKTELPEKTLEGNQQHDEMRVVPSTDSVKASPRDRKAPRGYPLTPVRGIQDPEAPTAPTTSTTAPDTAADEVEDPTTIERERQSQGPAANEHSYPPMPRTNPVQLAPLNNDHDQQVLPAAVMIASFLKQGMVPLVTPVPVSPSAALSRGELCHSSSNGGPAALSSLSPVRSATIPSTPTPLASLVTGVPTGGVGRSFGSLTALPANNITREVRSAGGGSRFFNDEWSPRLKERRRVVRFPKRSEPPGMRVLYWVRGNYRVRDNLALSAAMWLSTQLRMPLQAVTFVDPAIGRAAPSRLLPASQTRDRDHARGDAEQELPFRMAVEASALCEMEQSLRALNVPFVAIACPESEITTALAKWCAAARGSDTKTVTPPAEGSVHLAVADESYHPRQLWLAERAKEKLTGVALYTVDASCVCPVNTFRGARIAGTVAAAVGSAKSGASKVFSPDEFRKAQGDLLSIALAELAPRPRLPLDLLQQRSVLTENGAELPRSFESWLNDGSSLSPIAVIDWPELTSLATRRFPGFGKPTAEARRASPTEDLITGMGGGERMGEASLQQTLDIAAAHWPLTDQVTSAGGQHGVGRVDHSTPSPPQQLLISSSEERSVVRLGIAEEGVGFGGSLLHLLRLGSVSSIRVVQALFDRAGEWRRAGGVVGCNDGNLKIKEGFANLLEAVLKREYALYRAFCYYQRECRRRIQGSLAATQLQRPWRAAEWMGIVPGWVWEELRRGQLDARQHPHSPAEIRLAGSTVPSSLQEDALFSAIQAHLTAKARLHPLVVTYWARTVVKMMLIPSQAMTLLVELADELCLGARQAGDVITDLLSRAFDAFEEGPVNPLAAVEASASCSTESSSSKELPIFRRLSDTPLAARAGLESALFEGGGRG